MSLALAFIQPHVTEAKYLGQLLFVQAVQDFGSVYLSLLLSLD